MTRALILLALGLAGCASSHAAPIVYGNGSPARQGTQTATQQRAYAPPRPTYAQPQPSTRVDESTPQPNWADGPGVPLSQYATQPTAPDPRRVRPHRVEHGETFESIAQTYSIDQRSLALLNFMQPPYAVHEGDTILLPAGATERASASPPPTVTTPPPSGAIPLHPPPPPPSTRASTPAVVTPNPSTPHSAAPVGAAHFGWPLRGEVITHFGPQPGGTRLDGIEIAADEGAQALAADDGEVVYAGSDLSAYGTLVLVRHDNGYVTAYGYGRRALVREGQRVRKGQPLSEIGHVRDGPTRLLFQVRRGAAAIDPEPMLGSP